MRDKKTRLYPLTLHRKTHEKNVFDLKLLDRETEEKTERKLYLSLSPNIAMPPTVPDGDTLPTALLARTYVKEGLSMVADYMRSVVMWV